ncbi:MAG: hypothetical protein ACR2KL_05015 [Nocardioidaceae bacterium]
MARLLMTAEVDVANILDLRTATGRAHAGLTLGDLQLSRAKYLTRDNQQILLVAARAGPVGGFARHTRDMDGEDDSGASEGGGWRTPAVWAHTDTFEDNPVTQLLVPESTLSTVAGGVGQLELRNN